jgi:hypothetical protein
MLAEDNGCVDKEIGDEIGNWLRRLIQDPAYGQAGRLRRRQLLYHTRVQAGSDDNPKLGDKKPSIGYAN